MRSKVTKIIPDGATLARADGSAVNAGDEASTWETLTLTIPADSSGGSVQFAGGVTGHAIAERRASAAVVVPALAIGDTATPSRAFAPPRGPSPAAPAVKVE